MFDKIRQTLSDAGEALKEQAANVGEVAKEKAFSLIESWITALPKLEAYGFKTTYFSLSLSLNPTLEVGLTSKLETFPLGRVEAILAENNGSTPVNLVFSSIKTTLLLYERARLAPLNPLTVNIKVRLSPEVKVELGGSRN